MSSLLPKFVSQTDFKSYEDFKENLKIIVPANFNFAYDVVDAYAAQSPNKRALVWCNDHGDEKIITFGELKTLSDKAANLFCKYGLRKGDTAMLTLKSRWEFWVCMVGLNKIGAVAIPSTHMLKAKDFVYRIKKADLKMIVCIAENGVPDEFDSAHEQLGKIPLVKALVGGKDLLREGWINFDAELERASPNFVRPKGEAATKMRMCSWPTSHLEQQAIQRWSSTTRPTHSATSSLPSSGKMLRTMGCITPWRILDGQNAHGERSSASGWQDLRSSSMITTDSMRDG